MQYDCAVKITGTSPQTNTSNLTACANNVAQIALQKISNKIFVSGRHTLQCIL